MNRQHKPASRSPVPLRPGQYGIELRSPGSTRWVVVAAADDYDEAFDKLLSVTGPGDRRIRKPAHPQPARTP